MANNTVLMLHGFLGSAQEWQEIGHFLKPNYQLLCPDLPGHGNPPAPQASSLTEAAEQMIAWLDQQSIKQCHLLGYSMGGRLAIELALIAPERFCSLTLEGTTAGIDDPEERKERRAFDQQIANRLKSEDFEQYLHKWYAQPLFKTLKNNLERFNSLIRNRLQGEASSMAESLVHLSTGAQNSHWADMKTLNMPICLLVGQADSKFVDLMRRMRTSCPQAQWHEFAGCGHNIHYEQPEKYAKILLNFLEQINEG